MEEENKPPRITLPDVPTMAFETDDTPQQSPQQRWYPPMHPYEAYNSYMQHMSPQMRLQQSYVRQPWEAPQPLMTSYDINPPILPPTPMPPPPPTMTPQTLQAHDISMLWDALNQVKEEVNELQKKTEKTHEQDIVNLELEMLNLKNAHKKLLNDLKLTQKGLMEIADYGKASTEQITTVTQQWMETTEKKIQDQQDELREFRREVKAQEQKAIITEQKISKIKSEATKITPGIIATDESSSSASLLKENTIRDILHRTPQLTAEQQLLIQRPAYITPDEKKLEADENSILNQFYKEGKIPMMQTRPAGLFTRRYVRMMLLHRNSPLCNTWTTLYGFGAWKGMDNKPYFYTTLSKFYYTRTFQLTQMPHVYTAYHDDKENVNNLRWWNHQLR